MFVAFVFVEWFISSLLEKRLMAFHCGNIEVQFWMGNVPSL